MNVVKYIVGDATSPQGDGNKLIIHICNDINAWGAGFVLALSKKWPETKKRYHEWYKKMGKLDLGTIQTVQVEKDIAVINMIGQRGIKSNNGKPPIRYTAIEQCLSKVGDLAIKYNASVHGPRFGAGLAGGDWSTIEKIIYDKLCVRDIKVTIYDLPDGPSFIKPPSSTNLGPIGAVDPLEDIFGD
jgi:O-acetyl-ADP-ribose deacetylase (regulator of RNase III)